MIFQQLMINVTIHTSFVWYHQNYIFFIPDFVLILLVNTRGIGSLYWYTQRISSILYDILINFIVASLPLGLVHDCPSANDSRWLIQAEIYRGVNTMITGSLLFAVNIFQYSLKHSENSTGWDCVMYNRTYNPIRREYFEWHTNAIGDCDEWSMDEVQCRAVKTLSIF